MNNKEHICHLTSAHPQHDVRILIKECSSLAKHYRTSLIVVNGKDELFNNVNIINVNCNYNSRIQRFTKVVNSVFARAIKVDADIYHFHDPELLRIALELKRRGKKVVYDVHEDLPRQLLSKPYLNTFLTKVFPYFIEKYENYVSSKLDLIITATPYINKRFELINKNVVNINNFPLEKEIEVELFDKEYSNKIVCYIGGVTKIRGISQLVESLTYLDKVRLDLAGIISPENYTDELKNAKGWEHVNELGLIDRDQALTVKKNSLAGLVTFLAEPNHINAQPNKIFEYMASGLPVISSNFPLWKEIIEDNECGICVNPLAPKEIADAIQKLIDNPDLAKKMGKNGKRLVVEKYNWNVEEQKLLAAYKKLTAI